MSIMSELIKRKLQKLSKSNDIIKLQKAFGNKDISIRLIAKKRLLALGYIVDGWEHEDHHTIHFLQVYGKQIPIGSLIHALETLNFKVRAEITHLLGDLGNPDAIPPLIQVLAHDSHTEVKEAAAWALSKLRSHEGISPLCQALNDKDKTVRYETAWALGLTLDSNAIEPLIQALRDEDNWVRAHAAEALKKFAAASTEQWRGIEVMESFMNSLKSKAFTPLTHALKDENSRVRREAAQALGKIGNSDAVMYLVQALKERLAGEEAAIALAIIGDLGAVEGLFDAIFESVSLAHSLSKDNWMLERLFGAYTLPIVEILKVSRFKLDNSDSRKAPSLFDIKTQISTNILHQLAQSDAKDESGVGEVAVEDHYETYEYHYSFTPQREKAIKELELRGNPLYDPGVYLDKDAWKL